MGWIKEGAGLIPGLRGRRPSMDECICNTCKNLKGVVNDLGAVEDYECEYGFPAEDCSDCPDTGCGLACVNYLQDDGQEEIILLKCKTCGKELKQIGNGGAEGDVYCVDCFLKM